MDRQEMDGIALRAWSLPSGISPREGAAPSGIIFPAAQRLGGTAIGAAQAGIAQRGDVGLAAAQRPAPRADAGAKSRPLVSRLGSPRRAGPSRGLRVLSGGADRGEDHPGRGRVDPAAQDIRAGVVMAAPQAPVFGSVNGSHGAGSPRRLGGAKTRTRMVGWKT